MPNFQPVIEATGALLACLCLCRVDLADAVLVFTRLCICSMSRRWVGDNEFSPLENISFQAIRRSRRIDLC